MDYMCYVVDKITIHHSVGKVEYQNLLSCPVDRYLSKGECCPLFEQYQPGPSKNTLCNCVVRHCFVFRPYFDLKMKYDQILEVRLFLKDKRKTHIPLYLS